MQRKEQFNSAQSYLESPIDFDIPDIEPFLTKIKEFINFDEDIEASVAEQLKVHTERHKIWKVIPDDIKLELGYNVRFIGRRKQQILKPDENPVVIYSAGRGFGAGGLSFN